MCAQQVDVGLREEEILEGAIFQIPEREFKPLAGVDFKIMVDYEEAMMVDAAPVILVMCGCHFRTSGQIEVSSVEQAV